MTKFTTKNGLKQVVTYVDPETFQKLELARGFCSRSAFVGNVLTEVFENFPINHGEKT